MSPARSGRHSAFVLPTSMCDLAGYEPSRRAHDELCASDPELPDFGDRAFEGRVPAVDGPASRRAGPRPSPGRARRRVAAPAAGPRRRDPGAPGPPSRALPPLPAGLFGERGFQTLGGDVSHLHALAAPEGRFTTGVRVGSDVEPFLRRPPGAPLRSGRVRRALPARGRLAGREAPHPPDRPLPPGRPLRRPGLPQLSILAGFSGDEQQAAEHLLLAYLNSSPIRWFHYMRHRDARQGMPQLKIGHLRALPAPLRGSPALAALEQLGRELGARNTGISAAEQAAIDELAADALDLDAAARARIATWARTVRG